MRIAIVGAGAAGLASARHVQASENHSCVVFERSTHIGGTWVYTEEVGIASDGLPVHTSMYQNLRTNLPKEVMGFPDFPIPHREESYLPAKDILQFLNDYADHFGLRKHIKFQHVVTLVNPRDVVWDVTVKNLASGEETVHEFDAVMVCNGHYFLPFVPSLPGSEKFRGRQTHSHDYRVPSLFKGRRVVVVGAGPSGMDLTLDISSQAELVILSHHFKEKIDTKFPDNVFQKPEIVSLGEESVTFADGSTYKVDDVFYCTGYQYSFPFLSEKCNVKVEDNRVQPLFKHTIHIDYPTLCFIGLPFYVCAFSLFDLQARFFLSLLDGGWQLPSREQMLRDTEAEAAERAAAGLCGRQFHMMGERQGRFYRELAAVGRVAPLPPVLAKLHDESSRRFLEDLPGYRRDVYRLLDDHSYVQLR
ncbi:flavin-containing monooxygenase FMO GS-OX5 isoform X1 [Schistocerca piceifrons]|uniref:flavin-containing monooxygenase FMO GS-OX5 isoform X1 n=1 Tax=Schistocerca piceifrons TaxID=274613 RepID=UPI001F5E8ADB|nr:flavin-containing monooxygenase FMO GS-OX5 isoform X1 [Schistocerca piceifrons]